MQVLNYIVSLGASVMMPIIFTILGVLLGLKVGKSLKSGLFVGVGFVGLSVVTALLSDNLGPAVNHMVKNFGLNLNVIDIGWPAASAIAFGTKVGAMMIPIGLIVNIIMLVTKTTKTVNIDIWNYWHFAFTGSIVSVATGSMWWGLFAAVINFIITVIIADFTSEGVAKYYDNMEGISIPQGFCVAFVPFAYVLNKLLDMIPGIKNLDFDAEALQKKFGVVGDPVFLGTIIGCLLGAIAQYPVNNILKLGITMGAVMVLIPKITSFFIEGLVPISKATQELINKKFKNSSGLSIGMSPALVIGHPTTLVVSLLLVPFILFLSVIIPGNQFLPLTSLAGLIYIFPLVLPITKGDVFKTFIIGLIMLVVGDLFATSLAPIFTEAAKLASVKLPGGSSMVASVDYAASPLPWAIYKLTNLKFIGAAIMTVITLVLMIINRKKIVGKNAAQENVAKNCEIAK